MVSKCSTSWTTHGNTYSIFGLDEWVVDSNNLNVIMLDGISIDDTPDSSETVDSDVGRHSEVAKLFPLQICRLEVRRRGTLSFS